MQKSNDKSKGHKHKGHKKRLRGKFLKHEDFSCLYEHEILEMLISYSIKVKDTNGLAHQLMDEFGSLSGVFEAPAEELMRIEGIGEKTATLIKMQYELFRVFADSKYKINHKKYSEDLVAPYLRAQFLGRQKEFLYMICLDARERIISHKMVDKGFNDEIFLDMGSLMRKLTTSTRYVVIAHNHPNGILQPSQADLETTRVLSSRLREYRVTLRDHLIFTDEGWISIIDNHSFKMMEFKKEENNEENI